MTASLWRQMTGADVPGVLDLAARVHPGLPERAEVFLNRIALYGQGCLVLAPDAQVQGYAVAHPIMQMQPPPLDIVLSHLPEKPDAFYIHDVVVSPDVRGTGAARVVIDHLLRKADAYPVTCLISVYGTGPFWSRFGFAPMSGKTIEDKLAPYGPDAVYMLRQNGNAAF
ncbi:GNAT family N-acetyltransferase [Aureimonas fodinaquatilis]|uniref:GNAT family N-acetyltransferase n=1 Tax=Aureimonas fodinaquatilis TaxID=2565783 RepID=A0A5B0E118_9HYPH|nr:GNAT family N-acetyltransferase [Aureimonas fodinaquatilis]KAA0971815.1 GNAT family N-acetyltransferase [Aureimonas fodinaquatilis]